MSNNLKLYELWKRQPREVLNDLYHEVYGALQPLPRKRREIILKLDCLLLGHGEALYNEHTEVAINKKELQKRAVSVLNHKNFILRFKLQGVVLTCTEYYKIQSIRNLIESNEHFFVEIKGNEVFFKKEISLGDENFNQEPYVLTVIHFVVKDLQQKLADGRYTREQLELII
mgnify:CR=1 FL=1